ncbi:MAG: fimbrillin family protein [Bacteroides sp.]|uniref:fimbrillin family protein n=1 Tax=Bacteroides sp. TaxID=29523 RepID=UPI0026E10B81|nr:fimbrillin family protein [Bacteroides sp.]MDO5420164.1 fimbrillin family protein [Bacteroides sp.]
MRKNIFVRGVLTASLFCCISLGDTACVNKIEEDAETETKESNIPISFSIKMEKTTTKVTNTAFEKGDKMGLFATTASNSIKGKRYIDNLLLEYTEGTTLVPKRAVFYPEGDVPLNFTSYHPYQADGVATGASVIPVSVYADQSDAQNRSLSDFLVAKTSGVTSNDKAVPLKYQHKLSKLAVTLTPDEKTPIDKLKKDNPRIIATGLKTSADYDLENGTFSNLGGTKDIIASGEWSIKDNKLTGKEFIIIPQTINGEGQSFVMEWNGRIYSCAIPDMAMSSSTQCPIDISTMQNNSNTLNCFAGEISDWNSIDTVRTDNMEDCNAIHISALSFSLSNVYRIYHEGIPVAEVCREYLKSGSLTSRAVTVYPIGEKEKTDLRNGTILQLADYNSPICGGGISWNTDDYGFTFTEGNTTNIDKFYIDDAHQLQLTKPANAIKVNIACHTLLDIRKGATTEYPITKIGTQYWMGKELSTTAYRDGTALTKQTNLGKDKAGYYKPDKYDIYFYNGEAIKAGELAPEGWKIPSDTDWQQLKSYIGNDASLLKAGEWQAMVSGEVVPINNNTRFNAFPVGMWFNSEHNSPHKMTAFWSWDDTNNTLSENTIYFLGESNEFVYSKALVADNKSPTGYKDYYKALSIRCIKE